MYISVHRPLFIVNQILGKKMHFNESTHKQVVAHSYNGMLLNIVKKGITDAQERERGQCRVIHYMVPPIWLSGSIIGFVGERVGDSEACL